MKGRQFVSHNNYYEYIIIFKAYFSNNIAQKKAGISSCLFYKTIYVLLDQLNNISVPVFVSEEKVPFLLR